MPFKISSESASIAGINFLEQATAPSTPSDGNLKVYASANGLYYKDDGGSTVGPIGGQVGAVTINTVAQSINSGSATSIGFNTEVHDSHNFHNTSSSNFNFTIPIDGTYRTIARLQFEESVAGGRRDAEILLNGTRIALNRYHVGLDTASITPTILEVSTIYPMSKGDIVTVRAFQDSGGALNVQSTGSWVPMFSIFLV